jgi:hypothetical protein
MTITIVPEKTDTGGVLFRAMAGKKQAVGATVGAALDAVSTDLDESESGTLVLVQRVRADRFFTTAQQERLAELMAKWRAARDRQEELPAEEQAELEALVQAELIGATERAKALLDDDSK